MRSTDPALPLRWPPAPGRLRAAIPAIAVAAVLLPLTVVALLGGSREAPPSAGLVAVLPFGFRGAPEHAWLGEGLADLLAANLNGAGELRTVDPRALLPPLQPHETPLDPAAARRAAAVHGAGLFVLGSVTETAGRLRITAAMYGNAAHEVVVAAYQLGELIFHWGSAIGEPASKAREPFSQVLAAEPNNLQAALHLARIAARDGRPEEVDSLVAVMSRTDPGGSWQVEMDALRAFLSDDAAWQARSIEAAARQPNGERIVLDAMAAYSGNLAAVERIAAGRAGLDRAPLEQARMQLFLAHVQLTRGRYRAAERTIASSIVLPPARRLEYRAMMATLPFSPHTTAALAALRAEVAGHPDLPLHDEGGPFAGRGIEYPHLLWPGLYRPRRLYLLGALHARLGDFEAAMAVADSIARFDPQRPLSVQYERLTRARAEAGRATAVVALRALGQPQPPPGRIYESLVTHGRPYERWLRAQLLAETGRGAEALRWYGTFPDPVARDLP